MPMRSAGRRSAQPEASRPRARRVLSAQIKLPLGLADAREPATLPEIGVVWCCGGT